MDRLLRCAKSRSVAPTRSRSDHVAGALAEPLDQADEILTTIPLVATELNEPLRTIKQADSSIEAVHESIEREDSAGSRFSEESGRLSRVEAELTHDLEADAAVEAEGVLVRRFHPQVERRRALIEEITERVHEKRPADAETPLGTSDGDLPDPPAPIGEHTIGDPADRAPVAVRHPAAIGREHRPPCLERPDAVSGHVAPRGVDVDQLVHSSVILAVRVRHHGDAARPGRGRERWVD